MPHYEAPRVTELGSLDELTQSNIYKSSGSGDVVYVGGAEVGSAPGSSVTGVS